MLGLLGHHNPRNSRHSATGRRQSQQAFLSHGSKGWKARIRGVLVRPCRQRPLCVPRGLSSAQERRAALRAPPLLPRTLIL